jgi:hypothetical protein
MISLPSVPVRADPPVSGAALSGAVLSGAVLSGAAELGSVDGLDDGSSFVPAQAPRPRTKASISRTATVLVNFLISYPLHIQNIRLIIIRGILFFNSFLLVLVGSAKTAQKRRRIFMQIRRHFNAARPGTACPDVSGAAGERVIAGC